VGAWADGLLAEDLAPGRPDRRPYQAQDPNRGDPLPDYRPDRAGGGAGYAPRYRTPLRLQVRAEWSMMSAPENVLDGRDGLPGLLARAGAGDRVAVQQLSEPLWWGPASDRSGAGADRAEADPAFNPRVAGYLAAARRGAEVRVLLDGYFDDPDAANGNRATVDFLNRAARADGLDLRARLGNPAGAGLHNKMILVSAGCGRGYPAPPACRHWSHVGSVNGTETANKANREAGVSVANREVHRFLMGLFDADWAASGDRRRYLPALGGVALR
jgi:hypothetical protein